VNPVSRVHLVYRASLVCRENKDHKAILDQRAILVYKVYRAFRENKENKGTLAFRVLKA